MPARVPISRRSFLIRAATLAATAQVGNGQRRTRLILLGTGGGPRPRKANSAAAQVIVSNNVAYVIDCGDGVARQLVSAGVPLTTLRHVFITHQHSDHNADYGNLIWLAWTAGLSSRVDTWGPPPLENMTKLFFEMNKYDIDTRISNEGRVALAPLVHVHELRDSGAVMSDGDVRVTSALVDHPPVVPAFAYRFDARDRSIVISGDTAPSEALERAARDVDLLIHETYPESRLAPEPRPGGEDWPRYMRSFHTSDREVGAIAARAGVRRLVLYHIVRMGGTDEELIAGVRAGGYEGPVSVGRDLERY